MYSGTEAGDDALLPLSQSRSRLPGRRLGDMRPEGEGALQGCRNIPMGVLSHPEHGKGSGSPKSWHDPGIPPGTKGSPWGSLGTKTPDRVHWDQWSHPGMEVSTPGPKCSEATRPSCTHRDVGLFTPRLLGVSLATVESDRVDWE